MAASTKTLSKTDKHARRRYARTSRKMHVDAYSDLRLRRHTPGAGPRTSGKVPVRTKVCPAKLPAGAPLPGTGTMNLVRGAWARAKQKTAPLAGKLFDVVN